MAMRWLAPAMVALWMAAAAFRAGTAAADARAAKPERIVAFGERWYCYQATSPAGLDADCSRTPSACFTAVLEAEKDASVTVATPRCAPIAKAAVVAYHHKLKDEYAVKALGDVRWCEAARRYYLSDPNYDQVSACTLVGARLRPKMSPKIIKGIVGQWWCVDGVNGFFKGPDGTVFYAHVPGECSASADQDFLGGKHYCEYNRDDVAKGLVRAWDFQVQWNAKNFSIGEPKAPAAWIAANAPQKECEARSWAYVYTIGTVTYSFPTEEDCHEAQKSFGDGASRCTLVSPTFPKRDGPALKVPQLSGVAPCDEVYAKIILCRRLPITLRKSWATTLDAIRRDVAAGRGAAAEKSCAKEAPGRLEVLAEFGC